MSLRLRINLLITLLFAGLFVVSSFFILNNARLSVEREVESTARFALELIQIAFATASGDQDLNRQIEVLENLAEFEDIRHISIDFTQNETSSDSGTLKKKSVQEVRLLSICDVVSVELVNDDITSWTDFFLSVPESDDVSF